MTSSFPAVQKNCKYVHVTWSEDSKREDKRIANRRHRRHLNRRTKSIENNVELWYEEGFDAPTLSSWDID